MDDDDDDDDGDLRQCIKCDIRRSASLRLMLATVTLLLASCISLVNVVSQYDSLCTRYSPYSLNSNYNYAVVSVEMFTVIIALLWLVIGAATKPYISAPRSR